MWNGLSSVVVVADGLFLAGVALLPMMQFGTVDALGAVVIPSDVCFGLAAVAVLALEISHRGVGLRGWFPLVGVAYLGAMVGVAVASPAPRTSFERVAIDAVLRRARHHDLLARATDRGAFADRVGVARRDRRDGRRGARRHRLVLSRKARPDRKLRHRRPRLPRHVGRPARRGVLPQREHVQQLPHRRSDVRDGARRMATPGRDRAPRRDRHRARVHTVARVRRRVACGRAVAGRIHSATTGRQRHVPSSSRRGSRAPSSSSGLR